MEKRNRQEDSSAPRVSVVIPTYNRRKYINSAITSVLHQTYADFEIIVVDDGSTDGTEEVMRSIADGRVHYIQQEHSGLPAVARNTGLRHSRGEYIAFLDSDDLWTQNKLAVQVTYMDDHPQYALTYTNAYRFAGDPRNHEGPKVRPDMKMSGRVFDRLYGKEVISTLTVMIRSSVIDTVGTFNEDPRLKANEDTEYWLRIAHKHAIGYIDQPLAKYRHHPGGISKSIVETYRAKLFLLHLLDRIFPEIASRLSGKRRLWLAQLHFGLGCGLLLENCVSEGRAHLRLAWRKRPAALALWIASFLGSRCVRTLYALGHNLPVPVREKLR